MAKISRRTKFPRHKSVVDLNRLVAESYQVVGYMSYLIPDIIDGVDCIELAKFRENIIKLLDNLASGKLIHKDVLPILGPKI